MKKDFFISVDRDWNFGDRDFTMNFYVKFSRFFKIKIFLSILKYKIKCYLWKRKIKFLGHPEL